MQPSLHSVAESKLFEITMYPLKSFPSPFVIQVKDILELNCVFGMGGIEEEVEIETPL
jgi:hypothetical protein